MHTPLFWISGEMQWRPLHSPWFVVPGSDRTLLSRSSNTQYFPPELIVESDSSALWTKMLHRLLNRSPKWKGEDVSWKRLESEILIFQVSTVQTQNVTVGSTGLKHIYNYISMYFFVFVLMIILLSAKHPGSVHVETGRQAMWRTSHGALKHGDSSCVAS